MSEKTTLRQIWDEAEAQLQKYRHPDLTDFEETFNPILGALGQGSTRYDRIEELTVSGMNGKTFTINTSYSVRGCAQTGEYKIPAEVMDATFPIEQAHVYRTRTDLEKARASLGQLNDQISKTTVDIMSKNQKFVEALRELDQKSGKQE